MANKFGNYSSHDREVDDYYATHPSAVYPLFAVEKFTDTIIEPACGEGHMAMAIEDCGYKVIASDLIDRGYGVTQDFLSTGFTQYDIVTNPPYRLQSEFVMHAMDNLRPGGKLALMLKIQFLESAKRQPLFEMYPPARIHVFSKRARTAKNGDFTSIGSALTCYAWFVWVKGNKDNPTISWISPSD